MNHRRLARVARAGAWAGGLVGLLLAMLALGRGPLGGPALAHPSAWTSWATARTPGVIGFAALRLVILAVTAYLLAVTALVLAGQALRLPGLVRAADLVALPPVRSLLGAVAGLGLTASAGALVALPVTPARPAVVADAPQHARAADRLVLTRLPDQGPLVAERVGPARSRARRPGSARAVRPASVSAPPTWTVRPGEHLWSIAAHALADAWHRPPTDAEITPYWRAVIAANDAHLADPANPDLLFSGQVLALPAVPVAPEAAARAAVSPSTLAPVPSARPAPRAGTEAPALGRPRASTTPTVAPQGPTSAHLDHPVIVRESPAPRPAPPTLRRLPGPPRKTPPR